MRKDSFFSFVLFFLSDYVPRYKFIMLHILKYRALKCTHESQTCNIFLTFSRRVLARVDCSAAFAGEGYNLYDYCGQHTISARRYLSWASVVFVKGLIVTGREVIGVERLDCDYDEEILRQSRPKLRAAPSNRLRDTVSF